MDMVAQALMMIVGALLAAGIFIAVFLVLIFIAGSGTERHLNGRKYKRKD